MKREHRIVDKGRIPKENYHFPLMSKGEREEHMHGNKEKEPMHGEWERCMNIGGEIVTEGV
jgi:hypothetical protein